MQIVMDFTHRPLKRIDYAFTKDDYYRDPDGLPNIANLQHAIDLAVKNKVIKKGIDAEEVRRSLDHQRGPQAHQITAHERWLWTIGRAP